MNLPITLPSMDISWAVALPLVIVVVTALVAMMVDAFSGKIEAVEFVSVIGLAIALVACFALWNANLPPTFARAGFPETGQMVADRYGLFLDILFLVTGIFTVFVSHSYLQRQRLVHPEYHILMLFAISGMILMVQATELITIFVALEIFSISLYVLSAFARTRKRSSEAGLKYLLLGAFSSAFFLFGIAFVYGSLGTTNLMRIFQILSPTTATAPVLGPFARFGLPAGIGLLLVGLGFKVAAVPFHVWTPDVYEGAPTPVTAFMSVATKAAAFGALGRILLTAFPLGYVYWGPIVGALAVATMILGNVVAVWQQDIKRLLAYSSIAHAGYVLIALVGMSAASPYPGDPMGLLYYLASYTVMNFGAFAAVVYLSRNGQEYTRLEDFRGLAYRNTAVAVAMSIFMFSLAGIPPMVGFFAKWVLFVNAVQRGQTALVVVGVLASVVSAYYYLRVVVAMWMRAPEAQVRPMALAPGTGLVLTLCALATVFMGWFGATYNVAARAMPNEVSFHVQAPSPTRAASASSAVALGSLRGE